MDLHKGVRSIDKDAVVKNSLTRVFDISSAQCWYSVE
jgi:hypothetical protein